MSAMGWLPGPPAMLGGGYIPASGARCSSSAHLTSAGMHRERPKPPSQMSMQKLHVKILVNRVRPGSHQKASSGLQGSGALARGGSAGGSPAAADCIDQGRPQDRNVVANAIAETAALA